MGLTKSWTASVKKQETSPTTTTTPTTIITAENTLMGDGADSIETADVEMSSMGDVPDGSVGAVGILALDKTPSRINVIEHKTHMKRVSFALQTPAQLCHEWVNILKNEALVACLLLTQTCKGMDQNIVNNEERYIKINMWGDHTHEIIATCQVLITICTACCFLALGSAIALLRQLSLIPTEYTKSFLLSLGQSTMGLGLVAVMVALFFFAVFVMLVFTITTDAWVGYVVIATYLIVLFSLPATMGNLTAHWKKDALLGIVHDNPAYTVDPYDTKISMFWGFDPGSSGDPGAPGHSSKSD